MFEPNFKQMICPICYGFSLKLEAWDKMRTEARKDETCGCPECHEGSKWFLASKNISAWRRSSTCGKVPHPDLENPANGQTPEFCKLTCSLLRKPKTKSRQRETRGTPEEHKPDFYPPFAGGPCADCGWEKFAPVCCPVEMSNKPCVWTEKQPLKGPRGEDVYTEKTGTRNELIEAIRVDGYTYNYHKWLDQWTDHQAALDNETFNGTYEISVTSDFGATYKMTQEATEKCKYGTTCNQYVSLVLHSPSPRVIETDSMGRKIFRPRDVKCDVWRIWSQAKGNAAWHQKAMKDIAKYYKSTAVPHLKRLKVKTDGQRAQFAGQKNLGQVAEWPHPAVEGADCLCMPGDKACNTSLMKPGLGIEMFHDRYEVYHGSGPVDNYSKDARRGMDFDVRCGKYMRYNYIHCYDWCVKQMPAPNQNDKKEHLGTFGANGKYIWCAYSDGTDNNERDFPVIPPDRTFQALPGSNGIYAWRGKHEYKPELEALFVPCYCIHCRNDKSEECKYRHITHSLVEGDWPEYFTTHEIKTAGAAIESDGDDEW